MKNMYMREVRKKLKAERILNLGFGTFLNTRLSKLQKEMLEYLRKIEKRIVTQETDHYYKSPTKTEFVHFFISKGYNRSSIFRSLNNLIVKGYISRYKTGYCRKNLAVYREK